jgi:hypothetical protein
VSEALGWQGYSGSMKELLSSWAWEVWGQFSDKVVLFCRASMAHMEYEEQDLHQAGDP